MDISTLLRGRTQADDAWAGETKIPWHDPAFSGRMLREHLSQAHDSASRRLERIDQHVAWLHEHVLAQEASRVLDLGCGPGLYVNRLAALGHACTGIDFSPASIDYARAHAVDPERAQFILADVRSCEYGSGYTLAMMIFGELNAFPPSTCEAIVRKMAACLKPDGLALVEVHPFDMVRRKGRRPATWSRSASGLMADEPHVCLTEYAWFEQQQTARAEIWILRNGAAAVEHCSDTLQAYTDDAYRDLFARCGFDQVCLEGDWGKQIDPSTADLQVITARRTA
jgi:SAM-dependent methyltransferase